jgi:HK97 family phage major capsid protein
MSQKLKDLRSKRAADWEKCKAINDRSKDAGMSAEDQAAWDAGMASIDAAAAEIAAEEARINSAVERERRLAEIEASNRQSTGDSRVGLDERQRQEANPERMAFRHDERRALAMQSWALAQSNMALRSEHTEACRALNFTPNQKHIVLDRSGKIHVPVGSDADLPQGSAQRRYGDPAWSCGGIQRQRESRVGLDVGTAGAGQETIPEGFMNMLDAKTLAYGNVRQVATVIGTETGNSLPWPNVDDTGNEAAILAEATTIGTSVDPTFAAITLLAFKLSSKPVFVSSEILQDSAFNMQSVLAEAIGTRFGRGETTYFTTGNNSGAPQGIVPAASAGITSATAAAFTADEILALIHQLDPSYRALPSTGFMFHDTALLYMRKFKDANGQYLWQPGLANGSPDRLAGYPYSINQKMEPLVNNVPVTAKKHVLFGAFEKYIIRDAGGVRLYHLTERYRDLDQDCFVAFKRIDGRALNTAALKVLLQA